MRLDRQERRATLALVAALVLPVAVPAAVLAAAPPADEPLAERVEVRMVLLDVLVTDAAGRTVPDLGPGDFRLLVDSTEVPVRSVDRQCPVGVAADPTAVSDPGVRTPPPVPPSAAPRRLVLVLDYLHLARLRRTELAEAPAQRGRVFRNLVALRAIGVGDRL